MATGDDAVLGKTNHSTNATELVLDNSIPPEDHVLQVTTEVHKAHGIKAIGGPEAPGVIGVAGSGEADGVQGHGTGKFAGVAGFADPNSDARAGFGTGVFGLGSPGVRGIGDGGPNTTPNGPVGVYGQSGVGVDADGVRGVGGLRFGPQGEFSGGSGVHGISLAFGAPAVFGEAKDNSSQSIAIYGLAPTGSAGVFDGNVVVHGDFSVIKPGTKSAVVPFPDGSHRRLYCLESPESWFEDFGFGQLVNGQAQIQLDPDFAATVNTHAYHVFITEYEDNNALYVTKRSSTGFEVRAKASTADGTFSYRVVAKPKGITPTRLEKVTLPEKLKPSK